MNKIPHSSKESEAILRALLPAGKEITVRPMFGNLAAFVGGNMSVGLYGEDLFVPLSASDRAELLENDGAAVFETMKGRQIQDYGVVPRASSRDPATAQHWYTY